MSTTRRIAKALQANTTQAKTAVSSAIPGALPIQLFENANAWETWLESNCGQSTGLWLKISKKGSGIASVTYDEAFTPRRKKSMWSMRNVDKVAKLIAAGRMRDAGQLEVDAAKADGRWEKAYSSSSVMQVPADFQAALNRNKKAKAFFERLNKTKRYSFLWRIETAKRDETRQKRIEQFVQLLIEGKITVIPCNLVRGRSSPGGFACFHFQQGLE
ncbi:hypothetical protein N656DRAFT_798044 [Canariomyces notabilis]|uniref:Uncharacterized protein n=1 Tax=Canariomyces notabilis TaxID=2074819 RepID=A0AAN6TEB0_9PEZI|nr:hypothetical protein N656DRAFT_798044 [Canariomyces arenarius]